MALGLVRLGKAPVCCIQRGQGPDYNQSSLKAPASLAGQQFFLKQNNMPTIRINDKEYDLNALSEDARKQLQALQFVDNELQRLQAQAAVLQTARIAYSQALQKALPSPFEGDTLKFN